MTPLTEAPHHDAHHTHPDEQPRKGFFTDTSICIGCKACEVACKEWNRNPADSNSELSRSSYDNTGELGADTWRHVAFIEQDGERIEEARASGRKLVALGMPRVGPPASGPSPAAAPSAATDTTPPDTPEFRWLMSSDVCKHCTNAGCLDVCPTGALLRTEHGTVVVQDDVCNGCGTCVAGCPFGVIERRSDGLVKMAKDRDSSAGIPSSPKTGRDFTPGEQAAAPNVGVAQKCTLCYDRMRDDQTPACAQACPTESIRYGEHEDMVATARERVAELHEQGRTEARLYGANDADGVGGIGSVFLLLDEPEVYGLPPDPRVPTADLPQMYKRAGIAAAGMLAAVATAFLVGSRR